MPAAAPGHRAGRLFVEVGSSFRSVLTPRPAADSPLFVTHADAARFFFDQQQEAKTDDEMAALLADCGSPNGIPLYQVARRRHLTL